MSEGKKDKADQTVDMPDGSKKIDFSDMPLSIDGTAVTSIIMREPIVDDQLSVENITSEGRREVTIIANLCEQSPGAIGALKMRQYGRLQDAYRDFMG